MSTIAQEEVLLIKKLTEHATMPVRGSPLAAGFDLAAAYNVIIPAGGKGIAKTDLAMKIPTTCCKWCTTTRVVFNTHVHCVGQRMYNSPHVLVVFFS